MNDTRTTFRSAGTTLAGSLSTPDGPGPHPAILILAGSGPLDRDGNMKQLPLAVSRDVAKVVNDLGWATFRFDKRGVGESEGDYMSTGFFDELEDAAAAFEWLAGRDNVTNVVVVGHSVGATMAAELCARYPESAGAILLAFTMKTGERTLAWQTQQMSDVIVPAPVRSILKLFGTDVVKQQAKAVKKIKETTADVARVQMAKVNAKWMREFISYDPVPTLRRIEQPLLAITGSKDVQVDARDLEDLQRLLDNAETHVVEDVDHILRHEGGEISNPRHYRKQVDAPIDQRVIDLMSVWLASHHDSSPRVR